MVNEVASKIQGGKVPITKLVHIEVHEDRVQDFLDTMKIEALGTRGEAGSYRFDVLRDQENPCKFIIYEAY